MYKLSSSLADRIRFDEEAFAYARECIRAAEIPIQDIDPVALARHVIELEGLPANDDPEEAEARFVDAFCTVYTEMLRDAVAKRIHEIHLIEMPNRESLALLGDAAKNFDGAEGDLLLAPTRFFSPRAEIAAFKAGGGSIFGYAFDYPCSVTLEEAGTGKWCAYPERGIGYALRRDIAEAVCIASMLKAKNKKILG